MNPEFNLSRDERAAVRSIIQEYSVTYYRSTLLFPSEIRDRVFVLYAWVRQADEIVDNPEGDPTKTLRSYKEEFLKVWVGGDTRHLITLLFVRLAKAFEFKKEWCLAFLDSMESDLKKKRYTNRKELDHYIYGSADVIGLMMAKVMGVKDEGLAAAQQLGNWMQQINFLRDVGQDWRFRERIYIPESVLKEYNLEADKLWSARHTWQWHELIHDESSRLLAQKLEIEKGFRHLPKDCRLAVKVATELYVWTLRKLRHQPILTWSLRPTKPNKAVLAATVAWWSWKYEGLPRTRTGWRFSTELFKKGQTTAAHLQKIHRKLRSGTESAPRH